MGYTSQRRINDNYDVVGFISSGTYGRVYKARNKSGRGHHPVLSRNSGNPIEAFAIKKYVKLHGFWPKADLCYLGSSLTRKENYSIPAYHSLLYERWLSAQSCLTRMSSHLLKSFWSRNVYSWSLSMQSTTFCRSYTGIPNILVLPFRRQRYAPSCTSF